MIFNKKPLGFSLLEFVITTTILIMLSLLTSASVHHLKESNRNAKRVADVVEIQTLLEMYYHIEGKYPDKLNFGQSLMTSTTELVSNLPTSPQPWDDGGCPNEDYSYEVLDNQQSYKLTFCLGSRSGDVGPGVNWAVPGEIVTCLPNCVKSCGEGSDGCGGTCKNILERCPGEEYCEYDHCVKTLYEI